MFENCFNAFVYKLGLLLEASTVQRHQFFIEVDTKEVEGVLEVNVFRFPKCYGADRTNCRVKEKRAHYTKHPGKASNFRLEDFNK